MADDVLERLRARNRAELDLPCGKVTVRRPSMRDSILAGNVPLPVLQKLESNGTSPELTAEDLKAMAGVNDELVRRAVVAIDGEAVDLTGIDLADIFTDDERDAIVAYASRQDAEGNG
jgi:hypothetical protein